MRRRSLLLLVAMLATACGGSTAASSAPSPGASSGTARILVGEPKTIDPAAAGDAGSAAVIAQLFETLTTFDSARELRPALADSWRTEDGGRRVIFHLRPGLQFSDGTPLGPGDVVRSWLRLIDPGRPSPLASLMLDVRGAAERLAGGPGTSGVGLRADDAAAEVVVDLVRPATDFVNVVASTAFAVVPPGAGDPTSLRAGAAFVASGGYRLTGGDASTLTLTANPQYWAGPPPIGEIRLVTDLAGRSPVDVFEAGELDYAPIDQADATWITYDATLGPQLREVPSLSTDYYGFDTSRPPFDDVRVRQAIAAAVDWRRIARLALSDERGVATSMVPPGIPGRSDRDVVPGHDPAAARARLAEAGYPGGAGFPVVTLLDGGSPYDRAVIDELHRELGITVRSETMDFNDYFDRLETDPPRMWFLSWVADYPGRNDFLGVLLGTGSTNDYGRWSSAEFDAAIADALGAADEGTAGAAFDRAESIVQRDAPVIPVTYGTGWALARNGLLGAGQNGLGAVRLAGLAWAP
jgi:oligopeptide transport system substrate-binding protein